MHLALQQALGICAGTFVLNLSYRHLTFIKNAKDKIKKDLGFTKIEKSGKKFHII